MPSTTTGRLAAAGTLVLLLWASSGWALQEVGDNLFVGGFVSQGYLNTSENDYLVARSRNGTAAFSEVGVIVAAQPTDRLRVGIQLFGRSFGDLGRDQVIIDWAYGDYRWKDQLGFRAGKVKLPYGFYNEGRDADLLRTPIFLPQSIYNEQLRDFILAYKGVGGYGSFDLGKAGGLDYHVYGGTLNVPDAATGFWKDLYTEAAEDAAAEVGYLVDQELGNPLGTADAEFFAMTDPLVTFPWIFGGAVVWEPPVEGLRLGSTLMQGRFNFQSNLRYDVTVPAGNPGAGYRPFNLPVDETNQINHVATFSAEYLRNDWTLAAEISRDDIEESASKGWYVMAGRRFSDLLSLSAYYSDARNQEGDRDKEAFAASGLPDYYAWQKDLTLSARFDLTAFWLFKLEYHVIDGVGQTEPRSLEENLADPLTRKWGMLAARTTFYF